MTRRWSLGIVCAALAVFAVTGAGLAAAGPAAQVPHGFALEQDGPVSMVRADSGTTWAAWSYRRGLELDIAISHSIGQTWSPPVLIGTGNGLADVDPQLGFLFDGRPLLVWAQTDGTASRIVAAVLGDDGWSDPTMVAPDGRQPRLLSTADGLVAIGTDSNGTLFQQLIAPARDPSTMGGDVPMLDWGSYSVLPSNPSPQDEPDANSGSNGPGPMPTRAPSGGDGTGDLGDLDGKPVVPGSLPTL
jgi:hypothetical protein